MASATVRIVVKVDVCEDMGGGSRGRRWNSMHFLRRVVSYAPCSLVMEESPYITRT